MIIDKVQDLIARHDNLEKELSWENLIQSFLLKNQKEYSNLGNIITIAKNY